MFSTIIHNDRQSKLLLAMELYLVTNRLCNVHLLAVTNL